jgi:hypothetical protein
MTVAVRTNLPILAAATALGLILVSPLKADSTPIGPLPAGSVSTITTKSGVLVSVALPKLRERDGYVWRIARAYDAHVAKEVTEADAGSTVVWVFKTTGRGDTSLVFALTRGDASPKAVQSATWKIHSA